MRDIALALRETLAWLGSVPRPDVFLSDVADGVSYLVYSRLSAEACVGSEVPELIQANRAGEIDSRVGLKFYFDTNMEDIFTSSVNQLYPNSMRQTIDGADMICAHVFDLLGSGRESLGDVIPWHTDFKSGFQYPKIPAKRIAISVGKAHRADIKVAWELNRFQHLIDLGKAYWYTGDEKYAKEFCAQIESWIEENPVGVGVNWINAMESAIRAVNWIFAYYFFHCSDSISTAFWEKFLSMLFMHGRFILRNMEWYIVRGNHYVADLTGLTYLGLFFRKFDEGKRWLNVAVRGLMKEMERQVLPDGVHYEFSTAYHRLVAEMFTSSALVLRNNGIMLPDTFWRKLEKMLEFVMHYTKPSGYASLIGDNDSGRLHILGKADRNDHRYLLSIGSVLFDRGDFKCSCKGFQEDAFWMLGPEGYAKYLGLSESRTECNSRSKAFPHGGFYAIGQGNHFMVIRAGSISKGGPTGHAHCDALSFELAVGDTSFIVDPGTYVYTSYPEWRNLFRSTAYHNTIVVDGEEMNDFSDRELFLMKDSSSARVNRWVVTREYVLFEGEHYGYKRLSKPLVHRRQVLFLRRDPRWTVRDWLLTEGEHKYDVYFHLDDKVAARLISGERAAIMGVNGWNLELECRTKRQSSLSIEEGWVAPSYGSKTKGQVLRISGRNRGNTEIETVLTPIKNKPK